MANDSHKIMFMDLHRNKALKALLEITFAICQSR